VPIESKPGLLISETGDPDTSCIMHFLPDEVSVTIAIPDELPNSAT
jgi:hypothetical protein